jgi:hypothetical protein
MAEALSLPTLNALVDERYKFFAKSQKVLCKSPNFFEVCRLHRYLFRKKPSGFTQML